ncbi:MAG TPA: Na+/H+ antiporter subunit B [Terriglobales bacterium]|nr:Na+/H+ antiporter subunit B [Terriglobales bacterium]
MKSLILSTAARLLMPLMLLFSIFVFTRGHNAPGGGFIGGLVAASAVSLYVVAYNVAAARRLLIMQPHTAIAVGLLIAAGSGILALLRGKPLMTGLWLNPNAAGGSAGIGTPLLFDIGVFLVVFGVTVLIVFTLAED